MLTSIEKVFFLKKVDLFSHMLGEELASIAGIAEEIDFVQGETIIQEKDLGDSMFLLVRGAVGVYRGGQKLAELGEKQCFGEMAILDSEPRSATVRAETDVVALRILRDDFYAVMYDRSEIAHGIIKVLTGRLRRELARNDRQV